MTRMVRVWYAYGSRTYVGAVLAVVLAGCAGAPPTDRPGQTARQGIALAPDAQGLGIVGRAERIDFGRSPRGMIPIMDREKGDHRELGLDGCPTGVVKQLAWGDLVLTFGRERFIGWRQGAASAGTTCA